MNMHDYFAEDVKANLIQKKESGNLTLYKYKNRVFYKQLWESSDKIVDARGMVIDENGDIVINPLTKVFHPHEVAKADIDINEKCTIIEKVNGFMCSLSWNHKTNQHIFATTGSLDSNYIDLIKKEWYNRILPFNLDNLFDKTLDKNCTYSFEIVSLEDPHFINDRIGIYLLSARKNKLHSKPFSEKELDKLAERLNWTVSIRRPKHSVMKYNESFYLMNTSRIEGYIIKGKYVTLKMKTDYYSFLKYACRGKRSDKFWDSYVNIPWIQYLPIVQKLTNIMTLIEWKEKDEQEKIAILKKIIKETDE